MLNCTDGSNLSVPLPASEIENNAAPWPHSDQAPHRQGFRCVQGLLNLLPNGPEDGGLAVMSGSAKVFEQLWPSFEPPEGGWTTKDYIEHTPAQVQWLEDRGCKLVKPSLDPGDFIIWDSRTVHFGDAPKKMRHRFAVCESCYLVTAIVLIM